jgi:gamma-glutamylcyclotransferase (GGCT)/AIG2-like uncharacterized protein YtfP
VSEKGYLRVFAYGSNMCEGRLRERVPSARFVGVARLPEHVIRFHKRSPDRSGKADAHRTGRREDVVWGVVYDFLETEKPALDLAEGLGDGYSQCSVEVFGLRDERYQAFMYVAEPQAIGQSLSPYSWYKRFVVEGARQHNLSGEYIQALEAVVALEDPNPSRDARNRRIQC